MIGRVAITTINGETRIQVNGDRVTELCNRPLEQDLQTAIQELVNRNGSSIGHRRRKTRSASIDQFINEESETDEIESLINEISAWIKMAEDKRREIQLAKSRFTNTIQEKLGSNFTIQSIIVVDNNCILVNGKPLDQLLLPVPPAAVSSFIF